MVICKSTNCKCKHGKEAHVFDSATSFCAVDGCPCHGYEPGVK